MQYKKRQIIFRCYIMEGVCVDIDSPKAGRLRVSFSMRILGFFYWFNPSCYPMTLGSTQPVIKKRVSEICTEAWRTCPFLSWDNFTSILLYIIVLWDIRPCDCQLFGGAWRLCFYTENGRNSILQVCLELKSRKKRECNSSPMRKPKILHSSPHGFVTCQGNCILLLFR